MNTKIHPSATKTFQYVTTIQKARMKNATITNAPIGVNGFTLK